MFNLMLESVVEWDEFVEVDTTRRETVVTVSPGLRTGWNAGSTQAIVGLALPVTRSGGESSAGVLGYFSYELPFSQP
jgi:hypothetical protein